jgi:hypothetical protein
MAVLGIVRTADLAARHAHPQVHPAVAPSQAQLASVGPWAHPPDGFEMSAASHVPSRSGKLFKHRNRTASRNCCRLTAVLLGRRELRLAAAGNIQNHLGRYRATIISNGFLRVAGGRGCRPSPWGRAGTHPKGWPPLAVQNPSLADPRRWQIHSRHTWDVLLEIIYLLNSWVGGHPVGAVSLAVTVPAPLRVPYQCQAPQ